jgi:glycosyltransferase involved in cell wall biosynthesis
MSTTTARSSFLDRVEVLILTWNEEANIARTLHALARFPRIVILDSGSTDATLAIAAGHSNVRAFRRTFDSHAEQWNYGLRSCGLTAPWVLALDADYVLPAEVVEEIARIDDSSPATGYRASFTYCIDGIPLSGSLYPPVTVLFRREAAAYLQDGHTQRIALTGRIEPLHHRILHDDRKPLTAWLAAQDRYANLECNLLLGRPWAQLRWRDRLRRLAFITPWLVPLYCLTFGRGLLDGRAGLFYALQRGIAESLLSARLLEAQIFSQRTK